MAERYVNHAQTIFSSTPANPSDDLPTQMAKVGVAVVKGKTGNPPPLPDAATASAGAAASGPGGAAANTGPGAGPEPMDTSEVAAVAAADAAAAVAASGQPLDAANAGGWRV